MMIKSVQDMNRDEETGVVNWQSAIYSALYVYQSFSYHVMRVSPTYFIYDENIALSFLHSHQSPFISRDQIIHKKQIHERLVYLRETISGLRGVYYQFAHTKEGRKILIQSVKYNVDEKMLLRNSGKAKDDQILNYDSTFPINWIESYRIHAILDKNVYKLSIILKDGK